VLQTSERAVCPRGRIAKAVWVEIIGSSHVRAKWGL
jgi:hypothetical protein